MRLKPDISPFCRACPLPEMGAAASGGGNGGGDPSLDDGSPLPDVAYALTQSLPHAVSV